MAVTMRELLEKATRAIWFIVPHREWFIVWGGLMFRCKPRKQLKWVWLGDPLDITFNGCGPYDLNELHRALALLNGEGTP